MELDNFKACILSIAIGDKLGMPVETMTAEEIKEAVGGEIRGYVAPSINPRPFPEFVDLERSICTDDTAFTMAMIEAFIESGCRFDMDVIARIHVEASRTVRGMGRSTRNATGRLSRGVHWSESGEPGGSGNGVMMKIAPLGLLRSLTTENVDLPEESITLARMTHLGTPAIVAGGVHAFVIAVIQNHVRHRSLSRFLRHLQSWARLIEDKLPDSDDKISSQLERISSYYNSGELADAAPGEIASWFGGGSKAAFSAFNSFGLSYALFVRNPRSFDAVFDAVNAGGDTDTNASIVGSLVGAMNGMIVIPQDLLEGLGDRDWIEKRTGQFFEMCRSLR